MAIENNEYTSVMIKNETKQQLEMLKGGKNISYSKVIENLIQQTGGVIVEDVITIPSPVAFTLKYWNDDTNESDSLDVTFGDLLNVRPNDMFRVYDKHPVGYNWVNSSALVIGRTGNDVILKVVETACTDGKFSSVESVVHIQLF